MALNVMWDPVPNNGQVYVHFKVVDSVDDRICYHRSTVVYSPQDFAALTEAQFVAVAQDRFDASRAVAQSPLGAGGSALLLDKLPADMVPVPEEIDEVALIKERLDALEASAVKP